MNTAQAQDLARRCAPGFCVGIQQYRIDVEAQTCHTALYAVFPDGSILRSNWHAPDPHFDLKGRQWEPCKELPESRPGARVDFIGTYEAPRATVRDWRENLTDELEALIYGGPVDHTKLPAQVSDEARHTLA